MSNPRLDGLLVSWNDDRGFGFVRPPDGSANVFVHISSFGAMATRPEVGDIVSYRSGAGKDGRLQALDVRGPGRLLRQPSRAGPASLLVVAGFVVALFYINSYAPINWIVFAVYVGASIITFVAYGVDKASARAGGWRISEANLLVLGFIGGWPGAIVAQQVFRHKTLKTSFRSAFWGTVALNLLAFAVIATPVAEYLVRGLSSI